MPKNKRERTRKQKWTRRAFIGTGGLLTTGLIVGIGGNLYLNKTIKKYSEEDLGAGDSLNAWIRIAPDNTVTLAMARAEMGQGVSTALPMILAEELEVDMNAIKVVHPQPAGPYANTYLLVNKPRDVRGSLTFMEKIASFLPVVATGGSTSVKDGFDTLRAAGATAREMLISAAAKKWEVEPKDCYAESAHVINRKNKEKLSYGSLAQAASEIDLGYIPEFKKREDYKIIGKPIQRLDIPEKVNGTAEFGIDARPEGLLFAAIRHPQYLGGKISAVSNTEEIERMKGVQKLVILKDGQGVAVVADNSWRAIQASKALKTEEDSNGSENTSTETIRKLMDETVANGIIATHEDIGNVVEALDGDKDLIEADYFVPYLSQATMEPLNCTTLIKDGKAEVWVGHQGSSLVVDAVKAVTGIGKADIKVNSKYLGGGFGRKAELDYIKKSAEVSNAMPGVPIQTLFTREEDMRNGMYRPSVFSKFKATLDKDGKVAAWDHKIAIQSVMNSSMMRIMPAMAEPPAKDPSTTEGAIHLPYKIANKKVSFGELDLKMIQVGNWRSVGSSQNAFFTESFMDELAHAAGKDPLEYRKSLMGEHPRFLNVLNKVAEMSKWNQPLGAGKHRGIAIAKSFGSIVAEVAEITKVSETEIKINDFYCVIDCGQTINPDTIEAQMESGIMYGLTAAMYGKITIDGGQINEGNFPQYEIARMNVVPRVHVHIMESSEFPGGVGEPATPPAAPALTNAIFAATGKRIRSLPMTDHGFSFV